MNAKTINLLTIVLGLWMSTSVAEAQVNQKWFHDLPSAQQAARKKGLPILIHFSATWCMPCQKMESNVLNQKVVKDFFGKNFIACKIDGEVYPELLDRYRIQTYPTDIVLNSKGQEIKRSQGDLDIVNYVQFVKTVVPPQQAQPKPRVIAAAPPKTIETGLDGFCPVTLKRSRKWVKGRAGLTSNFKGIQYRFVSQEVLDEFTANPASFAPKLLGCDPVVLAESHRAIPGQTRYGAFFDEKLFLFSNSENRTRFKKNPLEFTRIQHAVKTEDIIRTAIKPKESNPS